ncbi:MAG: class I SAM-dependent methyltransferase [Anaerolineae bacterium]
MGYVKDTVQRQFGHVAFNYSVSPVHAAGVDLDLMLSAVELTDTQRVLDAGCGAGHASFAFAPHVAQVIAYDLTQNMLEQVNRLALDKNIHNIEAKVGDVENLPFEDASFDLVVSRLSAHHWPHPQAALAEFARVLKPNGYFVLSDTVSPSDPVLDTFLQTVELLRDVSHVRDHTVMQWTTLLSNTGFVSEVIHNWEIPLEFQSWVDRIATPEPNIAMIKMLFDQAPHEVRNVMNVQLDHSFNIQAALFRARKN